MTKGYKYYSIGELSEISGATIRTLQYYDQIGLLEAKRNESNLRYYTEKDLILLQQILFHKRVVDQLNLTLQRGVITGFLGPNGARKSTTVKMMISLGHPTTGQVLIEGEEYQNLKETLKKIGMLDGLVDAPNVVSITFADNEASYLAGIVAVLTSKTGKIGFVGGQVTPNIEKFQAGYIAGAKFVDPTIEIDAQYIESFSDSALAQQTASAMYANDVDIIFHAAGSAGNGVNTEARNRLESGTNEDIWVIGVDRDQSEEGKWEEGNFVLTSTLKELGRAAENEANDTMNGNFHGGEHIISNLEVGGVGIVKENLSDEIKEVAEIAEQQIISGEIEVPETLKGN